MTTRLMSAATAVMAFALLIAGNAWAQEFDPCAGLTGKAKGLCTAYSKGLGCSSDFPLATPEACANIATMLEEVTGFPPPSDCPCDFSLARISDPMDGWDASASYFCDQVATFDRTLPPGFPSGTDGTELAGPPGPVSLSKAFVTLTSGGRESDAVTFACEYDSALVPQLDIVVESSTFGEPDHADRVSDFIGRYDACRGAIGTLVANFPFDLSSNECSFD